MRFADVLTSFTLSYMHVYGILMLFRARVFHPEGCAWARCGEPRLVLVLGVESSTSVVLLLLCIFLACILSSSSPFCVDDPYCGIASFCLTWTCCSTLFISI